VIAGPIMAWSMVASILSATTHAPQAREVQQILSNLVALFRDRWALCNWNSGNVLNLGAPVGGVFLGLWLFTLPAIHKYREQF
jgi:hypothetical protein